MIRVLILALAVVLAGCGSAAPVGPAGVTEDPVLTSCRSGVKHANQNVRDVTALDLALHDCASLGMLEQALRDDPGYLAAAVDPKEFALNRCAEASLLSAAQICRELSATNTPSRAPSKKPKPTKKPASGGGAYYRPPGWNGSADVDCPDFDTHAQAQSFFKGTGGSKTKDPYKLDPDHDGIACESLP